MFEFLINLLIYLRIKILNNYTIRDLTEMCEFDSNTTSEDDLNSTFR